MAVNDFTGKNIKDTYPRLVQTDGTNLADGTGSILPLTFEGNNVKISGSLIANEYVVSSSVTNISIATLSGSTTFGDSSDDTHTFTGNITASGDISASGNLIASSSLTLGAPLSKIIGPGGNDFMALGVDNIDIFINGGEVINIDNDSINLNSSAQAINTTITSDDGTHLVMADATNNAVRLNNSIIMSPGAPTDYTNRLLISGSTHFTGSNSHITASGNISASGTIEAQNFLLGSVGSIKVKDTSGNTDDTAVINLADVGLTFGDTDILSTVQGDIVTLDAAGDVKIDSATGLIRFQDSTVDSIVFNAQNGVGQITASGNVSSSGEIIAASGSFEIIHGGTF